MTPASLLAPSPTESGAQAQAQPCQRQQQTKRAVTRVQRKPAVSCRRDDNPPITRADGRLPQIPKRQRHVVQRSSRASKRREHSKQQRRQRRARGVACGTHKRDGRVARRQLARHTAEQQSDFAANLHTKRRYSKRLAAAGRDHSSHITYLHVDAIPACRRDKPPSAESDGVASNNPPDEIRSATE